MSDGRGSDCLRPFRAGGIFERTKPRALPWAGSLRAAGATKMANSQLDFVSEFENQDTTLTMTISREAPEQRHFREPYL